MVEPRRSGPPLAGTCWFVVLVASTALAVLTPGAASAQTVGRAILLCGISTASGFGTLGFASNAGLAGLGRVCAAGILITSLVSVFLLPAWWRTLRGGAQEKASVGVS